MSIRAGWWIGGGLVGLGVIAGILWFVLSLMRVSDTVDSFERVAAGSAQTVRLDARKYIVYWEGPNADELAVEFDLTVADERGVTVPLSSYDSRLTYSMGGHEGSAGATVSPERPGLYRITVLPAIDDYGVAFGESVTDDITWTLLGAFGIGGLLAVAGTVVLAVTSTRQYKARRTAGEIRAD